MNRVTERERNEKRPVRDPTQIEGHNMYVLVKLFSIKLNYNFINYAHTVRDVNKLRV